MDRETIYFYDKPSHRVKEEHIFLNNFEPSPFVINGKEFKSVEHFYQASKFSNELFEAVRLCPDADSAKKLAHSIGFDEAE